VTTLVPSGQPHDRELDHLQSRAAELAAALRERSADLARMTSGLVTFKIRYRQEVGLLHDELDALELALAEAELGELSKRLDNSAPGETAASADPPRETSARYTSDAVRRLFRDVARAIHRDLARDESARGRRHTLMVEANRAYALGDEERLRRILQSGEQSPEAVQGSDPESVRQRLVRRIAQIEEQLEMCAGEMTALQETPLWKLKAMVDEAAARGKDLVGDMVRRLKRDILVARNRLDAMRSHP
jgi:hypothetical protein